MAARPPAIATDVSTPRPSPSGQPDTRSRGADRLFADLPRGYTYTSARGDLEDQIGANLERTGGIEIVQDLSVRDVEHGHARVATVLAVAFNDRATSADLRGLVNGMVDESGSRPEAVDLGGVPALYIDGSPKAFVNVDEDFFIAVFGVDRSELKRIATVLVSAVQ